MKEKLWNLILKIYLVVMILGIGTIFIAIFFTKMTPIFLISFGVLLSITIISAAIIKDMPD